MFYKLPAWFIQGLSPPLPLLALWLCHSQMVLDCALVNKIDVVAPVYNRPFTNYLHQDQVVIPGKNFEWVKSPITCKIFRMVYGGYNLE